MMCLFVVRVRCVICYGLCCVCVHCVYIVFCMHYLCGVYSGMLSYQYSLYVYCVCCLCVLIINKHDPWGGNRRDGRKGMLEMEKRHVESWEGRRQGWAHREQG